MIVQTFLRWAENASIGEREKAAAALSSTFLTLSPAHDRYRPALAALTHLLDDPAAGVRRTLAQTLAPAAHAPRSLILALAEDLPDIACHILTLSPVLTDRDLVDLVGRGSRVVRGLIAARPHLGAGAAAAIAEIGEIGEILLLLDNDTACLTRYSLLRIAARHAGHGQVRGKLLLRSDLPTEARERLVRHVGEALASNPFVSRLIDPVRLAHVTRQAADAATLQLCDHATEEDVARLAAHLAVDRRLTATFLMQALVSGRIDLFAASITHLCGLSHGRVRAVMATGRSHGLRALYESAGLGRDISPLFVEATLIWRHQAGKSGGQPITDMFDMLTETVERPADPNAPINELLDLVEEMGHLDHRRRARAAARSLAA
ncbi:DUF2336 domain-containing protein [Rhizobium sp. SGZ-381]|uniref:DUF2336 domain-containing protein n=1 Tax=Rhizobium sp. SGZ-381 TaxID=3342800 RepID=UPI003670425A